MSLSEEEVSLKILRLLYQYQKQKPDSGLDEKTLLGRFDFMDQNEGSTLVKKSTKKLIKLGFLSEKEKEGKKIYGITENGIRHYKDFKFLEDESEIKTPDVMVQGDWYGNNNHNNHYFYSPMMGRDGVLHFPGEVEEFIPHYDELLKLIEEIEKKAMDIKGSEGILNDITEMKAVISQDSSALGGKIKKLEELIGQLKIKTEKET